MGVKIFDKHKLEKKLKKTRFVAENLIEEIESQRKKIRNNYMTIGSFVIENNIQIENEEIAHLRDAIMNAKSKIQELQEKKKSVDKDAYDIEESLRILKGKIRCPKCGLIYEKKEDLLFCSKCGGSLEIKSEN